jgi:hypothetical protein
MKVVRNPGIFTNAKIKEYGISVDRKNQPLFVVTFSFLEQEEQRYLSWFGSLSGGAKDITISTLTNVLGYKGTTGEEIAGGIASGALDAEKLYDVTVTRSEYPEFSGNYHDKISFVNLLGQGSSGKVKTLDKSEASVLLKGANLGGDFLAAKQSNPGTKLNNEDIPF